MAAANGIGGGAIGGGGAGGTTTAGAGGWAVDVIATGGATGGAGGGAGFGPLVIAAPLMWKAAVELVGSVSVILRGPSRGFCGSETARTLATGAQYNESFAAL
jgi:hypothetical protein